MHRGERRRLRGILEDMVVRECNLLDHHLSMRASRIFHKALRLRRRKELLLSCITYRADYSIHICVVIRSWMHGKTLRWRFIMRGETRRSRTIPNLISFRLRYPLAHSCRQCYETSRKKHCLIRTLPLILRIDKTYEN